MAKKTAKTTEKTGSFSLMELPKDLTGKGHEIWLAGLGALSMVEQEGSKMFNTLVKKGQALENEGRKKLTEARQKVDSVVEEAAARRTKVVEEVDEKVISRMEESVERVLRRIGVPTHAEVTDLASKVSKLSAQVATLASLLGKDTGKPVSSNGTKAAVFHVVPQQEGWAVKREGTPEPISHHETKNDAVKDGRDYAQTHTPSRLVVHKKDGTIQESMSYVA